MTNTCVFMVENAIICSQYISNMLQGPAKTKENYMKKTLTVRTTSLT